MGTPAVSVVIPAHNEGPNLGPLIAELVTVLAPVGAWEVIVVDDGSDDDTRQVVTAAGRHHPGVLCLSHRVRRGKSVAVQTGIDASRGDVVVLCDGDGQNDPADIPRLLAELGQGADLVTGRRRVRQDRPLKRITSRIYNRVTAMVTGVDGRDFNSGLKAMSRDAADHLDLYGELHRYIPVLAHWGGFRVIEVDVNDRPRRHGRSKFGANRFWRGFLDLATVKLLTTYDARPLHLFGGIGMVLGAVGAGLLAWMVETKIAGHSIADRPALLAGVLFVITAIQLISLGLIAELVVHNRRRERARPGRSR